MSKPIACSGCRLRLLIRSHTVARQRQRWLSSGARNGQEATDVASLYEKFEEAVQQPRERRRTPYKRAAGSPRPQHERSTTSRLRKPDHPADARAERQDRPYGRYSGRPTEAAPEQVSDQPTMAGRELQDRSFGRYSGRPTETLSEREKVPQGRYSGQSARPQDLLADLAAPYEKRGSGSRDLDSQPFSSMIEDASDDVVQQPAPPDVESETAERMSERSQSRLSPSVIKAAHAFMRSNKRRDDMSMWNSIQELIRRCKDADELRTIGKDQYFNRLYFYWTMRVCDNFIVGLHTEAKGGQVNDDSPTPTIALNIRSGLKTDVSSTLWPYTLWHLSSAIAEMVVGAQRDEPATRAAAQRGMHELMSVWSLCMAEQRQQGREVSPFFRDVDLLKPPPVNFSQLPDSSTFQESLQQRGSFYTQRAVVDLLVPPLSITMSQKGFDYVSAALVTLRILQLGDTGLVPVPGHQDWRSVLEAAFRSATEKTVPRPIQVKAADKSDEVKQFYLNLIESFGLRDSQVRVAAESERQGAESDQVKDDEEHAESSVHPLLQDLDWPSVLNEASSDTDRFVETRIKNLGRALERRKIAFARGEYGAIQNYRNVNPHVQLPLMLYEHLMIVFLGLRDKRSALGVWRDMMEAGHQPTRKTYTAFMRGSQYVGDFELLQAFWGAMRAAGIQPDHHSWSTRIMSLFKRGRAEQGLQAMAEMSQEWLAAARSIHTKSRPPADKKEKKDAQSVSVPELIESHQGDVNDVPRPGLVVMNAAISALSSTNEGLIPKAITWGRAFGAEPNLITYNYLLNVAMRNSRPEQAFDILERMHRLGIEADDTTWTVLLTAMFEGGFLDDLDHEAQQSRVLQLVDSLSESNKSLINNKSYALIIDRLLKKYGNTSGAEAVLKHMATHDVKPSVQIYTILMASHFSAEPPNFRAIEGLWASMEAENSGRGVLLDSQFFDRMVEGYAEHHRAMGSTRPMLHFLERMQSEGKKASWKALTCASKALAERGEWDRLRSIVQMAKRDVEASMSLTQRFGQREFWAYVQSTGIIAPQDVPVPKVLHTRHRI